MTYSDIFKDTSDTDDLQSELRSLLVTLKDITSSRARVIGRPIFDLDEEEQQAEVDKLNPHLVFEFAQNPRLEGLPVTASGDGLMFVSDKQSGAILGAERLSDGDIVTGKLAEVCALPIPTIECLLIGDDTETPVVDQVLSPVVLLDAAVYKTGFRHIEQDYQLEHDLGIFQIGLPLEHYLRIIATK